jgi:hypothetical protein
MIPLNRFETLLDKDLSGHPKRALRDVADTAYACKVWFECYLVTDGGKVPFTGADVIAMTKLVLAREDAMVAAEESDG